MSLSTDALITVEEYFGFRSTGEDDIPENAETQVEMHINAISLLVNRFCGRSFITPSTALAEVFDGDTTKDYYAKNIPLAASPAPALAYWNGTAWTACTYTFTYVEATGRVYFTDGNTFWQGSDNWRLTYSYGYTRPNVPYDLKLAVFWMVDRAMMLASGKQGLDAENFGDQSTSYNLKQLVDANIMQVLMQYKRVSIG